MGSIIGTFDYWSICISRFSSNKINFIAFKFTKFDFKIPGTQFGTVVGLPLSGVLCDIELDNGWPWAFYVPGIIGVIWFLAWMVLVYDSPELHPHIAEDEKNYITATTGRKAATVSVSYHI